MQTITIKKPDDWHVHFRDGDYLMHTVPATATHCARALVMPNLIPPLTDLNALSAYRARIMDCTPIKSQFEPFMTYYLNESVDPSELEHAKQSGFVLGGKLYPAGATTNSAAGARSIKALFPLFAIMQEQDLVLQIHGEVTHSDVFDREALFIQEYLDPIVKQFPKLRIVLEHISTKAAVDYVYQAPDNLAATITAHHLYYNRNHLLAGGIRPHFYCLPILKRQGDQLALQKAAMSGHPKFFAGTDSAPHTKENKENACGCAGIYSAPYAIQMYTEVFANANKLNRLEAFLSRFGAEFYHLPLNTEEIHLINRAFQVPASLPLGNELVIPIAANSQLNWSIDEST